MKRVYVPGICPKCGIRVDHRYECNSCGHKWVPQSVNPKKCPCCGSPEWMNKNAEPYVKGPSRGSYSKQIEIPVDDSHPLRERVFVQPKQDYYTDEIGCQVCGSLDSYLRRGTVVNTAGIVETLLCHVCIDVVNGEKPDDIQRDWLLHRGLVDKNDFVDAVDRVVSVDDLKTKWSAEGVDVSSW